MNAEELKQVKEQLKEGHFPQWMVTDPEIYKLEQNKIFAKTWLFIGHESEVKEPGDYVTRMMADDPVLMMKNKKGEINAFLNSCSHRGTRLCTEDYGNKKAHSCPYHGWTYNLVGDLIGVVAGNKVFGEKMDKGDWGLRSIPRVESYQGMIFGNLDPDAIPLEEYLGDMKWYFDIMLGRSDGGMEVRGAPHRWVAKANWKMTSENFAADPYHVQTTHRSAVELELTPKDPMYASYGHQVVMNNGHGINVITSPTGESANKYQGMPEHMWPMFEKNLTQEQLDVFSKVTNFVGGVFPHLSFISTQSGTEGNKHNHLNFRVWRPIGPDKIEIWVWYMIDKALPEEDKEKSYRGFLNTFGAGGTLEQDDTENWARIVEASQGKMARDRGLNYDNVINYLMGFDNLEPDENFPGPGVAYPSCYTDHIARSMHKYWLELITADMEEENV
ncbi:aromatic ring-hydroxylating dioxygenase subunit alpha [Salibacterium salarium]|uniref:Aromatic ring-hydroxylating dioxygenase subunit alpha n=1 Tax=Salibacterium salarium TaxID=284579 RepID=A0A3R9P7N6_9BACI|nr:aromatic ring-hydroxylating dioxygenase subunit alpha [Salibacterium salarium]RSL33117.1 aromatic ring-hydroxylating dioxygenase subunit alpha [Salibacterium salarium]